MPLRPASRALAGAVLAAAVGLSASRGAAARQAPLPATAPPASGPMAQRPLAGCQPDLAERERLLALPVARFDRSDDGWRAYSDAHCYSEAASLVSDYVEGHAATLGPDDEALLRFHAAQMLADANRADDAVGELARVLELEGHRPHPDDGWRLYVQGTVAFLKGDRPALDQASKGLDTYAAAEVGAVQAGDRLNLNALHGLQRCFGRGYGFAYASPECRDFDEARRLNAAIG